LPSHSGRWGSPIFHPVLFPAAGQTERKPPRFALSPRRFRAKLSHGSGVSIRRPRGCFLEPEKGRACEFTARARVLKLGCTAPCRRAAEPEAGPGGESGSNVECNLEPGQVSLPILWRCLARALSLGSNTRIIVALLGLLLSLDSKHLSLRISMRAKQASKLRRNARFNGALERSHRGPFADGH